MKILHYSDLNLGKLKKQFKKVEGFLAKGDFKSADVKKMVTRIITVRNWTIRTVCCSNLRRIKTKLMFCFWRSFTIMLMINLGFCEVRR